MTPEVEANLRHLWSLLFEIVLDGEKRLHNHFAMHGLTTPQFYVLKTLIEHEGRHSIGQIARAHGLTNATMTGLVERLEAQAPPLVIRESSTHDRRSVDVVLTEAGRARFTAVQESLLDYLRAIFVLLEPTERQAIIDYLSRYIQLVVRQFPRVEG
jgi:DNA-binding MarR family transcriptional regulator